MMMKSLFSVFILVLAVAGGAQSQDAVKGVGDAKSDATRLSLDFAKDGIDSSTAGHRYSTGNVQFVADGRGRCAVFNGKDSKIAVPGFRISDYLAGSFSVDFWIKPSASGKGMGLFWEGDDAGGMNIRLAGIINKEGRFEFAFYNNGENPAVESGSVIAVDKWTNIQIDFTARSYLKLYIDGKLEDAVCVWSAGGPHAWLRFGEPCHKAPAYFNGMLKDFRVSSTDPSPALDATTQAAMKSMREERWRRKNDDFARINNCKRGFADIVAARDCKALKDCSIDADGRLVMEKPGSSAEYFVYTPAKQHYRLLFRAQADKDAGEMLIRASVAPVTASPWDFCKTGSVYVSKEEPKGGQDCLRWYEIGGEYSFLLTEGWSSLTISLKSKSKEGAGKLTVDALTLTPVNEYSFYDRGRVRISSSATVMSEKLQKLPYRIIQVEYPSYYTTKIRGSAAKEMALRLIKGALTRDVVPNGFNWVCLSVYSNWPRTEWSANSLKKGAVATVQYPTENPLLAGLVSNEEDCIPEIIEMLHENGVKVMFYMPYLNGVSKSACPIPVRRLELDVASELMEKYHPDGLAYEGLTGVDIWKDLKGRFPKTELFYFMAHHDPFKIEEESQGAWNCITMDTIDYQEEVFPPITTAYVVDYAAGRPVADPASFRKWVSRALDTPRLRGIILYYLASNTDCAPYCTVFGDIYRGACSSLAKDGAAESK